MAGVKQNADDYLLELASQRENEWFKRLVQIICSTRSVPDDDVLDGVYEQFMVENELYNAEENDEPKPVEVAPVTSGAESFYIEQIKHEEGVNNLCEGEEMPLHPKLTVIYGKNASGKSGFVRIFKRIAGARTQVDIWQNIHEVETQNDCSATFTFVRNDKTETHEWDGSSKVAPFDQMAVFDGSCIPLYLNSGLDFSYQPYGFELFNTLTLSLKYIQRRLEADISEEHDDLPELEDLFRETTVVGKLIHSLDADTETEELDKLPGWNADAEKQLEAKRKELKGLDSVDKSIELQETYLRRIQNLEAVLNEIKQDLNQSSINVYLALVKEYLRLKKEADEKRGSTLEDYEIAELESEEWDSFISAGEDYIRHALHDEYPNGDEDECIYCQQKLTKRSKELIALYRELFGEDEEPTVDDVEEKIDQAQSNLEYVAYSDELHYDKADFNKFVAKSVIDTAFGIVNAADTLNRKIISCLEKKKVVELKPITFGRTLTSLQVAREKVTNEVDRLRDVERNLHRRSLELTAQINELEDRQKLQKYREAIEEFLDTSKWIQNAEKLIPELRIRPITDLGSLAWKELVSDSFKDKFTEESLTLNAPGVALDIRGEYGTQVREKTLEGLNHIDKFLSEGEQRAVSLADFFAELSMQEASTPAVFDDPATSFDFERKEQIAKRIVQESESRQVVVFTHDLMFASYLHIMTKKEKDIGIDPEKARFHNIKSNAENAGILTADYYPGAVKYESFMIKLEENVSQIEGEEGEAQMTMIKRAYDDLRTAIEKVVEERIFGGVILRWSDRIQMHNVPKADLDAKKLTEAQAMHEEFSAYISAHNQSDEMIQHATPELEQLKKDVERVKALAVRG